MSALDDMLAAMDDAALVALANAGLVRRARKALAEDGAVRVVQRTGAEAQVEALGQVVLIGADGVAKARCDCPATGLCRHIVMAVQHLRETAPAPVQSGPQTAAVPPKSARADIAALSAQDIKAFAGADWPQAQRIAAWTTRPTITEADSSCAVLLPDAPGAVTFVAGGGLRKALFKGPDGRRKRFVAAAALVLGGHRIARAQTAQASVDAELLDHAAQALRAALQHGLEGDPLLAQDRLVDVASAARAEAAPRLAALLRAAARQAGALARHDPGVDPQRYAEDLAQAYALTRALRHAPADPALTGLLRRDYPVRPACTVAMLGAARWDAPSGARGLTLHGWDGQRYVRTGPARAAGMDPTFSPKGAYVKPWWAGHAPKAMVGHQLHLPAPKMSQDSVLPEGLTCQITGPLDPDALPVQTDWAELARDVAGRMGLGLRAATHPVPALVRAAQIAAPERDDIAGRILLPLLDATGAPLRVVLPSERWVAALRPEDTALVEIEATRDGRLCRLISVIAPDGAVVNVTLDPAPVPDKPPKATLWTKAKARLSPAHAPVNAKARPIPAVERLADQGLALLGDGPQAQRMAPQRAADLARQAVALGLDPLAAQIRALDPADSDAILRLCWALCLLRTASQNAQS